MRDDVSRVEIDLAQAYYRNGAIADASEALRRAANDLPEEQQQAIYAHIARIQGSGAEPWDIRNIPRSTGVQTHQSHRVAGILRQAVGAVCRISPPAIPTPEAESRAAERELSSNVPNSTKDAMVTRSITEWLELSEKWQHEIYHNPVASLETAIELYESARSVSLLVEGCSIIALGSSSFSIGDFHTAEACFDQARPLLINNSTLAAEINRKVAAIRNREGEHAEAFRLLAMAKAEVPEGGVEYGQILLQQGLTYQCQGDASRAVACYTDSISRFAKTDLLYFIAVNNAASALVTVCNHEALLAIAERIQEIRRTLSPRSAIRVRLDWISLISSICLGDSRRAIEGLPKIKHRLFKHRAITDDLSRVEIDLAQAYYRNGSIEDAAEALRRAAKHLSREQQERLDTHVSNMMRLEAEPWDIRDLPSTTGISCHQSGRIATVLRETVGAIRRIAAPATRLRGNVPRT